MKNNTLAISLIVLVLATIAVAQQLNWLVEVPKNQFSQIQSATFMESDAANNLYVVELQTSSSPGGTAGSARIIKFNAAGDTVWTINAPTAINPVGFFDVNADGTFFITGHTNTGFPGNLGFLNKYDTNGILLWSQTFPFALMGRAIQLANGNVRVEGSDSGGAFAATYTSEGVFVSREVLQNAIVSTDILNRVAASRNNAQGVHCGLIPTGSVPTFAFAKLDSNGAILYSLPAAGILFPANLRDVEIDDSGACIFAGQTSGIRLQIGSTELPADEIRSNFLARISTAGVVEFIRVYDLQYVDDVECRGTGFSDCWLSGSDLVGSPTLARLDSNFNIVDLFHGPEDTTRSFKIEFAPSGRLGGAFTVGQASGTWFGSPIVVPSNPSSPNVGSMFVFQIDIDASRCTTQCSTGSSCCHLSNNEDACFSENLFNCFTDAGMLCAHDLVPCGNACINPSQTTCIGTFQCPINHMRCGAACYRPSVHNCIDGFLCPVGTFKCGTNCYSPSEFNCCNGELCPAN